MAKRNPIRTIREAIQGDERWKAYGSQEGFARLVGRSTSLIRRVEAGQVEFSVKLARAIRDRTGVSKEWLLSAEDRWDEGILAEGGGGWTPTSMSEFLGDGIEAGGQQFSDGMVSNPVAAKLFAQRVGVRVATLLEKDLLAGRSDRLIRLIQVFYSPNGGAVEGMADAVLSEGE